uniref:BCL7-like protein n=1 Tax=Strongyloides papillosus TaxID=174720 RepID=A0A0N5B1U1_STREA
MFNRNQRAETRNRAKDELKKVINAIDRVRKWEKKWINYKDSSISVYKWVPVSGPSSFTTVKSIVKTSTQDTEDSNAPPSVENSMGGTNSKTFQTINEDSNTGFLESNYDSDSNQTFDRINYRHVSNGSTTGSTDFSSLRAEEKGIKEDSSEPPAKKEKTG